MEQLPKEVAEGIPPQSDWKDAPGELVWRFEADSEMEHLGLAPFSWQVKKLTAGVHYPPDSPHNNKQRAFYFEASTPYRSCYYVGTTAEEALGALMKGVCLLSREGAINPNFPYEIGAPIIQHVMHVLSERLLWNVEQRNNHVGMGGFTDITPVEVPSDAKEAKSLSKALQEMQSEEAHEQMLKAVARDNEVISALATAISALARVKDL